MVTEGRELHQRMALRGEYLEGNDVTDQRVNVLSASHDKGKRKSQ
jgi:hypothetical protein